MNKCLGDQRDLLAAGKATGIFYQIRTGFAAAFLTCKPFVLRTVLGNETWGALGMDNI